MNVFFTAVLLAVISLLNHAQSQSLQLPSIGIAGADSSRIFTRSLYSVEHFFAQSDTVLFVRKSPGLTIVRVDSISRHELEMDFRTEAGFDDFGSHTIAVFDSSMRPKLSAVIDVTSMEAPSIAQVLFIENGKFCADTLVISSNRRAVYGLCLRGRGLLRSSILQFDDPAVTATVDARRLKTCELQFNLQIDLANVELGLKSFRISGDYAPDAYAAAFFKAENPPRIISTVNSFTADGRQQVIELQGKGFMRGLEVELEPNDGIVTGRLIAEDKLDVRLTLPMLEQSKSYRLIVRNKDGQADTSAAFIARAVPLSSARVVPLDHQTVFSGRKERLLITVDTREGRHLSRSHSYEVLLDGDPFPMTRVINDSTGEAEVWIKSDGNPLPNQHLFTVNQTDKPPQWRGTFSSRRPPTIDYISQNRVLHPADSLGLVIKGKNLKNASVIIEEPEVSFRVIENRNDLIRLTAIAGSTVMLGTYPLELRIDDVSFVFDNLAIDIKPWQPFSEFITFHLSSSGELPPEQCCRGLESQHLIKAQDIITVRINTRQIRQELGIQKIVITGVLTDSSGTIRAEAFDSRMISVAAGDDETTWRWRVRERIRSGDRIEISLRNPGNHNKMTEYFIVTPHWSEAFHGSTSFVLFRLPFGNTNEKTQILNSIGLGISYQPFMKQSFLEFDASFIVGNTKAEKSDIAVEVSFGLSAIFWQHLQIGVGSNLTGAAFSKGFMFVGTRFKLPISL